MRLFDTLVILYAIDHRCSNCPPQPWDDDPILRVAGSFGRFVLWSALVFYGFIALVIVVALLNSTHATLFALIYPALFLTPAALGIARRKGAGAVCLFAVPIVVMAIG
jgi:hypothetical protein